MMLARTNGALQPAHGMPQLHRRFPNRPKSCGQLGRSQYLPVRPSEQHLVAFHQT
jgi:hypothetical protein